MKLNKAEHVEQAYDDAYWFANFSKEVCYKEAVDTAYELGGVEIYNSNDHSSWSFTPTRTFEFDDLSIVQVMYDGVICIMPNQQY